MLTHAMQFAENYQANADKLSARAAAGVRHPSLFVFLGESGGEHGDKFAQIERHAVRSGEYEYKRFKD